MSRTIPALVILVAGLGAACTDQAIQEKNAALEKRLAELEKQATPSPSPDLGDGGSTGSESTPEGVKMTTLPAEDDLGPATRSAPAARRPAAAPAARAPRPRVVADDEPVRPDPAPTAAPPDASVEPPDLPADPPAREQAPSRPEPILLPEGTELTLVLETGLSSATSQRGDRVTARVEKAVSQDGRIVLPGGTVLEGHVSDAAPSGRVKGRARVSVAFDRIIVRGRTHELQASPVTVEAPDDHGRDAKMVGGAAAAGTVIGAITGGKKGAVKGAVIGGAVGGGAVLATKGREIEMPAGSRWKVQLRDRVRL